MQRMEREEALWGGESFLCCHASCVHSAVGFYLALTETSKLYGHTGSPDMIQDMKR